MSSIRPLITITILVVVGAVLYVKINEGTADPNRRERRVESTGRGRAAIGAVERGSDDERRHARRHGRRQP